MTTTTRKTYIGKKRDEESYLGDFGVRKYDYAAGRFTSPDVLWEKYINWSPYQYCKNNPIIASDPSGLLLALNGSSSAYDKLNGIVTQGTGNMYGTSVGNNGVTSLISTGLIGVMTGTEQAFYNGLSNVMDPATPKTSINLSEGSPVQIGSYNLQDIDINDVLNLGQVEGINSSSALIHEVSEQFEKQSKGLPQFTKTNRTGYDQAHKAGVKAEDAVSGARRLDISSRQPTSTLNTGTGNLDLNYMINNSTRTISIEFNSNNVIGIKR